ncbi:TPA: hypothetical protein RFV68_001561 [Klebsiella variicola]|nr:hypothetical protein [Klebsiella variicola]
MNHTLSDSLLEAMIKSAVNSSGPLPPDEKFSQLVSALRELQERRKADSEPVAEVVSIYGDPEAFGEREIRPLVGIQQMPCGTKLYRHAQPAQEYPEVLPCPVLLEPGMRFGKGVKIRLVLEAIQRRAEHCAELEAMTPDERAEYDANIEAFKAMLPQPAPLVPDGYVMVPKEATEKMLIAGLEEANPLGGLIDWDASRGDCNTREQVQEIFKAMLAAAPQEVKSES